MLSTVLVYFEDIRQEQTELLVVHRNELTYILEEFLTTRLEPCQSAFSVAFSVF